MKNVKKFLFLVLAGLASCAKLVDPQEAIIDSAVQSTIIAHAVASTLTAQPSSQMHEIAATSSVVTSIPEFTTTPTTRPVATATPIPTTTPTPTPTSTPTPPPLPFAETRLWDIVFELISCTLSGKRVICDVAITNQGEDIKVELHINSTLIYDDFGYEYYADEIHLANKDEKVLLVSGVRTSGSVIFENVSPEASKITLFHARFSTFEERGLYWDKDDIIEFRNIPIEK